MHLKVKVANSTVDLLLGNTIDFTRRPFLPVRNHGIAVTDFLVSKLPMTTPTVGSRDKSREPILTPKTHFECSFKALLIYVLDDLQ